MEDVRATLAMLRTPDGQDIGRDAVWGVVSAGICSWPEGIIVGLAESLAA